MTSLKPTVLGAPQIPLGRMPQLAEAASRDDDWTGLKDAAERRRSQTRLNTRAYRKRKARAKGMVSETRVDCWDMERQSVYAMPASRIKDLYNSKHPLLPQRCRNNNLNSIFPLSADHLITLLQFNVIRALAVNRTLISGILASPLDCADEVIHTISYPSTTGSLPSSLLPTTVQQTIVHGDWIDIFPCPEARDHMILATGTFDEDELWADCVGGLFEGFPDDEVERRGMTAWSPPWDIAGWEMSEGFLRKWGWLFKGLSEPIAATNRWRAERGEEPLDSCVQCVKR